MECKKAVVKNADMSDDMQQCAVDTAAQAMTEYSIEKDIAAYIKKHFDKNYGPTWHCVVGKNFGRVLFNQCCLITLYEILHNVL
ncbi:unnamed protein product [Schistosoma rodhaini]|uniref:Dynein light chain n=1 Tax=Schistosoma rodhaini TaxID=6188 RepID=A0AA85EU31_9TREM|nr:unnamed protein product [Schistosoma rodhaini]